MSLFRIKAFVQKLDENTIRNGMNFNLSKDKITISLEENGKTIRDIGYITFSPEGDIPLYEKKNWQDYLFRWG